MSNLMPCMDLDGAVLDNAFRTPNGAVVINDEEATKSYERFIREMERIDKMERELLSVSEKLAKLKACV